VAGLAARERPMKRGMYGGWAVTNRWSGEPLRWAQCCSAPSSTALAWVRGETPSHTAEQRPASWSRITVRWGSCADSLTGIHVGLPPCVRTASRMVVCVLCTAVHAGRRVGTGYRTGHGSAVVRARSLWLTPRAESQTEAVASAGQLLSQRWLQW
jgi:hypothetical protein